MPRAGHAHFLLRNSGAARVWIQGQPLRQGHTYTGAWLPLSCLTARAATGLQPTSPFGKLPLCMRA